MTGQQLDMLASGALDQRADIAAGRHGGNPESEAANLRAAPHKAAQRQRVLTAIRQAGCWGLTCRELAGRWGVGMNAISGRFSELKRDGVIQRGTDAAGGRLVRDGCAVYVIGERWGAA